MKNLHGIKVGDTVYHLLHGWEGTVTEIDPQADFPLCIESSNSPDWYTMDGRMFPEDVNPTWVAIFPVPLYCPISITVTSSDATDSRLSITVHTSGGR